MSRVCPIVQLSAPTPRRYRTVRFFEFEFNYLSLNLRPYRTVRYFLFLVCTGFWSSALRTLLIILRFLPYGRSTAVRGNSVPYEYSYEIGIVKVRVRVLISQYELMMICWRESRAKVVARLSQTGNADNFASIANMCAARRSQ